MIITMILIQFFIVNFKLKYNKCKTSKIKYSL